MGMDANPIGTLKRVLEHAVHSLDEGRVRYGVECVEADTFGHRPKEVVRVGA